MASTWAATASNETISFNNLQNGVDTGVLSQKASIPVSNEQITKADANTYVNIDTSFAPYAAKSSNQLVVKSNFKSLPQLNFSLASPNGFANLFYGIANNETTSGQVQLICGWQSSTQFQPNFTRGVIYRSTDYGITYSLILTINDLLNGIKYMPSFRHASYLSVPPFVSVGHNGRIVTNSVTDATSWITISSPTTQDLYDIAFNSTVGIIVGNQRIIKTNTNNRINAWSIVNSVASVWRAVASDGARFVAVGNNSAIISGDSLGTTWSVRSMPALTPSKQLRGVTYHTDAFFYAVGFDTATPSLPYIMRSSDSGFTWENYSPTGDSFIGALQSIRSIGGRLVIGGDNYQYQIFSNVVTRYDAASNIWRSIVKDANSNGFDMCGDGGYSNF
jgi:hypothetical protein